MGRLKSFFHDEIVARESDESLEYGFYPTESYSNLNIDGKPLVAVIVCRNAVEETISLVGAYTDRMDAESDLSLLLMGKRVFAIPEGNEYFIQSVELIESPNDTKEV
jgi:hypothetical protein